MKKTIFCMVVIILIVSMAFISIGCKDEASPEVIVETVTETVTETVEVEKEMEEEIPLNADGEPIRIANATFEIHHVYRLQSEWSEIAGKDYGIVVDTFSPADMAAEWQTSYIELMENLIIQGYDGIACFNWSNELFHDTFINAFDAGIILTTSGGMDEVKGYEHTRLATSGADPVEYAEKVVNAINEARGGQANIIVAMTNVDIPNQVAQLDAIEAKISAEYPEMKIITQQFNETNAINSIEDFQAQFKAYPEIDTVICLESGASPQSSAQVAEEMGIIDDMTIIAIDDADEVLQMIRDGKIYGTMAQNFRKIGYEVVRFIADHYLGNEVPEMNSSGYTLITSDNINSYYQDMIDDIRLKGEPY